MTADYQRSADGTFADGELTVAYGQQEELAKILDLLLSHLDPTAVAASAARGVPIGVTTIPSTWGTIRVRAVPGGSVSATGWVKVLSSRRCA